MHPYNTQTSSVLGPQGRPYGEDLTNDVRILHTGDGLLRGPIATGVFSDVYKGAYDKLTTSGIADTIYVAVKILRVSPKADSKMQTIVDVNRRLIRESDIWVNLNHRNIQPYLGHCSNLGQCVALVSPFCDNGTILDYIDKNPAANRMQLVKDTIEGLRYLHKEDVIHGDLHCNNVLVNEAGIAVLTDFGRAKVIGKAGFSTTFFVGHASYMAPELVTKDDSVDIDKLFSKKSDIYAFGMICFRTFTNDEPFASYNVSLDHQISFLILSGKKPQLTNHVKNCVSENMWRIMVTCWKNTPKDRLSAEQIIQRMN